MTGAALDEGLRALGLEPAALAAPLERYLALLGEWNAVHNLTAIRDPADQVTKHLLDSLAILPWVPERGRLLDVGTGAGLPGIPLALARPTLAVTLLDSRNKKARFCQAAIAALGLTNASVVHARAEDHCAEPYDAIVSRAVGSLAELVRFTEHLGDGRTRWLTMKGAVPSDELAALPAGFVHRATHPVAVPGLDAARCLVELVRAPPGKSSR